MNKNHTIQTFFIVLALAMATQIARAQYTIKGQPVRKERPVSRSSTVVAQPVFVPLAPPPRIGTRTDDGMVEHMTGIIDNIPSLDGKKVLYLTLDLCSGGYDAALVEWLIQNKVQATFFITSRWLFPERKNSARPQQFQQIYRNPLFSVENHGRYNLPASCDGKYAYGIAGTENLYELENEVMITYSTLKNSTGGRIVPEWYRSGGARYDTIAVDYITRVLEQKVAGFAITVDAGATLNADQVYAETMRAKSGDILLGNANRPNGGTRDGLIRAITELRARGFVFRKLPKEKGE